MHRFLSRGSLTIRAAQWATAALLVTAVPAVAQTGSGCADDPVYHTLDFWVGDWDVFVGDTLVGTNRIEKVLSGCALIEHWRGSGGDEGKSLFYHQPATQRWKQVWVTARPMAPGGVKEKELIEIMGDGGLRFQGTIPLPGGGSYGDRTTLTPLPDGRVRQVIEIGRDGQSWQVTFDAVYVRRAAR